MTRRERPSELSALLCRLQNEFEWGPECERFDLVDTWERRSGSRLFHMAGHPNGPEVVVKTSVDWKPGEARRAYEAMVDLDSVARRAATEDVRAIRPLGWSSEPEALVMPYVAGEDLVSILRTPDHPAWDDGAALLRGWLTQIGLMLAAYHSSRDALGDHQIEAALRDAREVGRRAAVPLKSLDRILAGAATASRLGRCFGDFGPGNVEAASGGVVYLLDPPTDETFALVHRDVGNFLFELRRQLAGRGFTPSRPVRRRFGALRGALLEGYSAGAAGGPLNQADLALVDLFEMRRSMGMARKRFPRRPADAAWFVGSALRRRWALARYSPE